jgi:hypothetical protein
MKVWVKAGDLLSNGFDPDEVSFFRTLVNCIHPKEQYDSRTAILASMEALNIA